MTWTFDTGRNGRPAQHAIEHGGRTIAVLGTPLDKCFPAKSRELQDLIAGEHLAVSQFAPETKTGVTTSPSGTAPWHSCRMPR